MTSMKTSIVVLNFCMFFFSFINSGQSGDIFPTCSIAGCTYDFDCRWMQCSFYKRRSVCKSTHIGLDESKTNVCCCVPYLKAVKRERLRQLAHILKKSALIQSILSSKYSSDENIYSDLAQICSLAECTHDYDCNWMQCSLYKRQTVCKTTQLKDNQIESSKCCCVSTDTLMIENSNRDPYALHSIFGRPVSLSRQSDDNNELNEEINSYNNNKELMSMYPSAELDTELIYLIQRYKPREKIMDKFAELIKSTE